MNHINILQIFLSKLIIFFEEIFVKSKNMYTFALAKRKQTFPDAFYGGIAQLVRASDS